MSRFLDAIGLNDFFKGIKGLFAKKEEVKDLNALFQVVEINGNLMAVCDKESNILCFIDANGKVNHPLGTKTSKISVDGDALVGGITYIGDCKLVQGDDSSLFYILDSEDHMLLWINADGTTDHYGIPTDVKKEIDSLKERVTALEGT